MEEEPRRILRAALVGTPRKKPSFKEYLLSMPNVGQDKDFMRGPQLDRPIEPAATRTGFDALACG
jgi:hypothetical protein